MTKTTSGKLIIGIVWLAVCIHKYSANTSFVLISVAGVSRSFWRQTIETAAMSETADDLEMGDFVEMDLISEINNLLTWHDHGGIVYKAPWLLISLWLRQCCTQHRAPPKACWSVSGGHASSCWQSNFPEKQRVRTPLNDVILMTHAPVMSCCHKVALRGLCSLRKSEY